MESVRLRRGLRAGVTLVGPEDVVVAVSPPASTVRFVAAAMDVCCLATSARTSTPVRRKKFGRGLGANEALTDALRGIETFGVTERWVELADGVTDRGLQNNAVPYFWQVAVRGEPVGDLADRDVRSVLSPQGTQLQPERVRPQCCAPSMRSARRKRRRSAGRARKRADTGRRRDSAIGKIAW
jgi:hypothetical protein